MAERWEVVRGVTSLLLIRHGDVDYGSRLCGACDVPLSPLGRVRLDALVKRSPAHPAPNALYTSPLTRARDVATALGRAWSLQPQIIDAVREIHCGSVEGMRLDDLQRLHPQLWASNTAQMDDEFRWPGGERYCEFRARVLRGLGQIAAAHPAERVAVITHAGVIAQVLGTLRGRPAAVWELDRPAPLTLTEVTWTSEGPQQVIVFNDSEWY